MEVELDMLYRSHYLYTELLFENGKAILYKIVKILEYQF